MLLNKRISILYFINLIKIDIAVICLYAIASAILIHTSVLKGITISSGLSAMVSTLVSLLLAFKTAQSYDRWWEARIVWGGIVNDSRTLIRLLKQYLPKDETARSVLATFARRQIIWCFSLADSLRKKGFSPKVEEYLSEHAINSTNVPNYLLNKHAEDLAAIAEAYQLDPNIQVQFDAVVARLNESMGRCERIKNTVFPKSYSLLIRSIIYIFLTIFPFGLTPMSMAVEILLTILVPVLFISIERTAIILQDPFENRPTDTPMTTLSQTIERNIEEMLGLEPAPQLNTSADYFSM